MRLLKNTFYSFLGSATPFVVALVTIPLFVDAIGLARYGALSITWLLLGYFGTADFGMGRAITQRVAALGHGAGAKRACAVWSALVGMLGLSLITAAIIFVTAHYYFAGPLDIAEDLRDELLETTWLLALAVPVIGFSGIASGALMGTERFKLVSFNTMTGNILIQVLPLVVAWTFSTDLAHLVLASVLARFVSFVPVAVGCWHALLRYQPVSVSGTELKSLTRFGAWVMVSALIGPLMIYADRLVIGAVFGAVAVAIYTIPFQIAYRTQVFPLAIVQALFPRFAAETAEASQARCRDYAMFVGLVFAPVVIGLIALCQPLLQLWLGSSLDPRSVLIGQLLLVGIWFTSIANVPLAYVQARGNTRFTALLHLVELPLYAALLFVLGSEYGLAGFAAAFSLRCALDCLVLLAKSRLLGAQLVKGLAGPAALVGVTLVLATLTSEWLPAIALAVAAGIASLLLAWLHLPDSIRHRLAKLPVLGPLFIGSVR